MQFVLISICIVFKGPQKEYTQQKELQTRLQDICIYMSLCHIMSLRIRRTGNIPRLVCTSQMSRSGSCKRCSLLTVNGFRKWLDSYDSFSGCRGYHCTKMPFCRNSLGKAPFLYRVFLAKEWMRQLQVIGCLCSKNQALHSCLCCFLSHATSLSHCLTRYVPNISGMIGMP